MEKLVKIRITDAYNIGYVAGHEYSVTPEEAAKLIAAKQAIPILENTIENTAAKPTKIETRTKK